MRRFLERLAAGRPMLQSAVAVTINLVIAFEVWVLSGQQVALVNASFAAWLGFMMFVLTGDRGSDSDASSSELLDYLEGRPGTEDPRDGA